MQLDRDIMRRGGGGGKLQDYRTELVVKIGMFIGLNYFNFLALIYYYLLLGRWDGMGWDCYGMKEFRFISVPFT